MKKVGIILLTIVTIFSLTGCVGQEKSKTCTMKEINGIKQSFTFKSKGNEINKMDLQITFDSKMFGKNSLESTTEAERKELKENLLKNLGLEKEKYEGLEIIIDINEDLVVTLKADIKKADPEMLKKVGMNIEGVDMGFDRAISDMESLGATCK